MLGSYSWPNQALLLDAKNFKFRPVLCIAIFMGSSEYLRHVHGFSDMTEPRSPSKQAKLPNLYALLGLQPLEGDRSRIEQALRQLQAQAQATQKRNPQQAARMQRIVELAKQNLLNAQRKPAYDQQWQKVFAYASASVAQRKQSAEIEAAESKFLALLPPGDPEKPFDLSVAKITTAGSQPAADHAKDLAKLQSLLGAAVSSTTFTSMAQDTDASEPLVQAEVLSPVTERVASPAEMASADFQAAAGVKRTKVRPSVVPRGKPPASLAMQLRKKRERSMLLAAAGLLASVAIVLGLIFFLVTPEKEQSRPRLSVAPPENAAAAAANPQGPTAAAAPTRSGLPSVAGLAGNEDGSPMAIGGNPDAQMAGSPNAADQLPSDAADLGSADPDGVPAGPMPAQQANLPQEMETPAGVPDAQAVTPEPESQSTIVAELTEGEQAAWQAKRGKIKFLIGNQEYATAAEQIQAARADVRTPAQSQQLEQLSKLRELAQEFHAAMTEAIQGLSPAEVFTVGTSTQASFVEGNSQSLSVRIRGQNQTFPLTELPIGLAFAVADLKLDSVHPSDMARRAAFAVLHPGAIRNELAQSKARQMMADAVAAGAVSQDMLLIFSDDF